MIAIKDNIAAVELQIASACQLAHRNPDEVTLLAVSKTKPIEMLEQAYHAGQRNFGENYVQEAVEKIIALQNKPDITWHFIGPIQTNKTKLIASHFSWVHSIDRIKVAKRLNEHRSGQDTPLNICLQVNISGELSKAGVLPEALPELLAVIETCDNLCLRGLMAIPEKNAAQASFVKMQNLFIELKQQYPTMDTLSMGMSADLQLAINAGSTLVRIGSAIFGARS
ncbi:YggS family pyridoxal phosphate-dependent enzyme [Colwellia sp. MB02u-18]|uniref:YggS family pyridoxal phosphate-dependent enzyme n=1 Tax=unclassified Colwellia TaxID=196834 RepID=UPI0015F45248|nr:MULTISPECIES: YggS family pyridoxal phosphate-dependent enzyme [unclassified Colwellia]MBA6223993.1 YggS family pyridoxal phosphate-dependent enzyme [Colwellia sp. MB3u-45]MBA6266544.1 YggS family pyridoxal phosphate-dependent enzyme [Colwellia sp. MB3u-43]MBA6296731.1 YggS family pyridoxal phosphate-dependent enzyme [Colwellia sp. MB02u-9]MBA6320174.1 YggS family pyridoxal phosphate-dependent enzyme [Colwellia sp. MB02u-19]MBA6325985.1 YggS family pyridoxal phosphate-dependent enzyme [Colw